MQKILKDRVALVTGATSGLGKATAQGLAYLGATVVMTGRDRIRGAAALEEVRMKGESDQVRFLLADLSSLQETKNLALSMKKQFGELHILVNNAAIGPMKRKTSRDGIELQFAVGHLSHFLLTNLLLDLLEKSGEGRIINITSKLHRRGKLTRSGPLTESDPYHVLDVYGDTKLANVLFTYELHRRMAQQGSKVTVNALHPGMVATHIWREIPRPLRFLMTLFMNSSEKAARPILHLASHPSLKGVSGKYFDRERVADSSPLSHDGALARRLWDTSERLAAPHL